MKQTPGAAVIFGRGQRIQKLVDAPVPLVLLLVLLVLRVSIVLFSVRSVACIGRRPARQRRRRTYATTIEKPQSAYIRPCAPNKRPGAP
jgi:hypothetical protein